MTLHNLYAQQAETNVLYHTAAEGHVMLTTHSQSPGSHAQARSMTDKARIAAAGAMNNVRTAIDSAKRIGFPGNPVSFYFACMSNLYVANLSTRK